MGDYLRTSIPVVLFDGETETSIGNFVLQPSMGFRKLQYILCRVIGIAPHQFSILYAGVRNHYRRCPVTNKINLWEISRDEDGYLIVALRQTRRQRRGKDRAEWYNYVNGAVLFPRRREQPADALLLRRDANGYNNIMPDGEYEEFDEFRRWMEDLLDLRQWILGWQMEADGFGCEECERAYASGDAGFHPCVNDAVITGFRSTAGPIARPA
ncbi:hypothetical protein SLEP1_g40577 [Rubroshorea leprosula]|uniref:DUF7138 domain-containing protein n=1 Tax=Rubroshorea leprosula TaxID=152421 RepID=A0AAV5L499_9ROSI|nr:hypothetical protein SLEP1_g40577 [Rubroshorea leprosula]